MNTGSSASAAVLRNSSRIGLRKSATGRYQAIAKPSGIVTITAITKPVESPRQAGRNMFPQLTVPDQGEECGDDLGERWQEHLVDEPEPRCALPYRQAAR